MTDKLDARDLIPLTETPQPVDCCDCCDECPCPPDCC